MSAKNKHMQYEDRLEIQECLNKGMTFKAIARRIGKDPTTNSILLGNASLRMIPHILSIYERV